MKLFAMTTFATSVRTTAVVALSLGICMQPAQAQSGPGPESEHEPVNYYGLHVGQHDIEEWPGVVNLGASVELDGLVEIDPLWEAGLLLGREYENSRYELEYQLGKYEPTRISLGNLSEQVSGSSGKYQALTLNAYRMQELGERLEVYAGLGIGFGKAELPALGFTGGCQCFGAAEESGFIWQARAGLEYRLGATTHLFLQYTRIMNMPGPMSSSQDPGIAYPDTDIDALAIGLRKQF